MPTLSDLPHPPSCRTGWPWTTESLPLPPFRPDGSAWPRITIVTPSYNQGKFIEETIRSVLLQGYPNLEYMIMDGGSTDETVAIIKKYEGWITRWVSERDSGQCNAINKGMACATGELRAWINSDDGYLPSALGRVAEVCIRNKADIVVGNSVYKRESEAYYVQTVPLRRPYIDRPGIVPQHSTLWRSEVHEPLDERLHCALDTELWRRLFPNARRIIQIPYAIAYVNIHAEQKTSSAAWDRARIADGEIISSKHPSRWWQRGRVRRAMDYLVRLDSELDKTLRPSLDVSDVARVLDRHLINEAEPRLGRWAFRKVTGGPNG